MIFVAVGTQLPFDRMIKAVDAWCAQTGRGAEVFGQIGQIGAQNYIPEHFEWAESVEADVYRDKIINADVIVSHAGMGSIITALSSAKPIVILARRAHLGEQRNDHQVATMKRLGVRPGIFPAQNETELSDLINQLLEGHSAGVSEISSFAEDRLISKLRGFINGPEDGADRA